MIAAKGGEAGRDRTLGARGPQPHIDVVEIARFGQDGERIDVALRQAGIIARERERSRSVRRLDLLGRVIDENEVEIGGRAHLAAAELAEPKHDQRAARHAAVALGELRRDPRQQAGERRLGDVGEGAARRLAVEPPAQELHADLELALADPAPREIEQLLVVPRAVERRAEIVRQGRKRRQRVEEPGGQHAVEQARPARDLIGKPRTRRQNLGEQRDQVRIVGEEREGLDARRQAPQQLVEAQKSRIGTRTRRRIP